MQTMDRVIREEVFELFVDYDKSLREAIVAGRYAFVNKAIHETNFPRSQRERGNQRRFFRIYRNFPTGTTTAQDILSVMNKDNKRPATLRELLAVGAARPEMLELYSIHALLSSRWIQRNSFLHTPYLHSDPEFGGRYINLSAADYGCNESYAFLGVSK